jgi:hypothetical protein
MTDLTPSQCLRVIPVVEQALAQLCLILPDQSAPQQLEVRRAMTALRMRLWELARDEGARDTLARCPED